MNKEGGGGYKTFTLPSLARAITRGLEGHNGCTNGSWIVAVQKKTDCQLLRVSCISFELIWMNFFQAFVILVFMLIYHIN